MLVKNMFKQILSDRFLPLMMLKLFFLSIGMYALMQVWTNLYGLREYVVLRRECVSVYQESATKMKMQVRRCVVEIFDILCINWHFWSFLNPRLLHLISSPNEMTNLCSYTHWFRMFLCLTLKGYKPKSSKIHQAVENSTRVASLFVENGEFY